MTDGPKVASDGALAIIFILSYHLMVVPVN